MFVTLSNHLVKIGGNENGVRLSHFFRLSKYNKIFIKTGKSILRSPHAGCNFSESGLVEVFSSHCEVPNRKNTGIPID